MWVHVGWHVNGMQWEKYLGLTIFERVCLHEELNDMIEQTNSEGGSSPQSPNHMT